MTAELHHWTGQAWLPSDPEWGEVTNSATGEVIRRVPLASKEDVDRVVAVASEASEGWMTSSISTRTKVMFAFAELMRSSVDDLATLITEEHGKTLDDARGEVQRGLEVAEFACGVGQLLKGEVSNRVSSQVDAVSSRYPLGVVAGITPFNFPVMVPMWMAPIAIACGNAFVLKPSEQDPSPSLGLARLFAEAGLPAGVFNVIHGARSAVEALLDHPDVAAASFVGSTPIARAISERATAAGKRVQALGGAKNHGLVLPDCDPDFAADNIAAAAFGSAGERCMALPVVVAVGDAADPLLEALRSRAEEIVVGPGSDPSSQMGPLISRAHQSKVRGYIDAGAAGDAELIVDGRSLEVPGHEDGFFIGPTLFDRVSTDEVIYTDEIFGPVLCVLRVEDFDQGVELINANPYGNGASIFTASGSFAQEFDRRVTAGMVGVNVPIPVPVAYHSFGGWKDSLFGDLHIHGPEGVRFYTRGRVLSTRWQPQAPGALRFTFPVND